MKIKSRFRILILLCAIITSFAAIFAVMANPQTASANAADTVFDISGAGGRGFNADNLKTLMGRIMGKEKASYNELKAHLDINATKSGSQINTAVKLGGQTWNVVYASETTGGDVIATLWLAESEDLQQWNNWYAEASHDWDIPSNMYGASYVRSYLTGSSYAKALLEGEEITDGTLIEWTKGEQSEKWRDFVKQYGNYITTPLQVSWQETESAIATCGTTCSYPNEAYGMPEIINWQNSVYDYSTKNPYNGWKYDKLWLPSFTETGGSTSTESITDTSGLWEITKTVRTNTSRSWLRSGSLMFSIYSMYLTADGNSCIHETVIQNYAVRPAFHLNLKTAAAAAGLTVEAPAFAASNGVTLSNDNTVASATYSDNLTFNLTAVPAGVNVCLDSAAVDGNSFTVKEAGTHLVTMTPKVGFSWADGSLGAKTLTVVVNKAVYDMSAVKWTESNEFDCNGKLHSVTLTGLPKGVTAIYQNNSSSVAGEYVATVGFLYDTVNYYAPSFANTSRSWKIKPAANTPVDPGTPPASTEPIVITQQLSGGAIAAIVVCALLAVVAIVTAVTAIVFKKTKVVYDGGFYDEANDE